MDLTNMIDSAIKEAKKMHEKFLIDMLNNHGVPINKENLEEYDGLIGIRSRCYGLNYEEYDVLFHNKKICAYRRRIEMKKRDNDDYYSEITFEELK